MKNEKERVHERADDPDSHEDGDVGGTGALRCRRGRQAGAGDDIPRRPRRQAGPDRHVRHCHPDADGPPAAVRRPAGSQPRRGAGSGGALARQLREGPRARATRTARRHPREASASMLPSSRARPARSVATTPSTSTSATAPSRSTASTAPRSSPTRRTANTRRCRMKASAAMLASLPFRHENTGNGVVDRRRARGRPLRRSRAAATGRALPDGAWRLESTDSPGHVQQTSSASCRPTTT